MNTQEQAHLYCIRHGASLRFCGGFGAVLACATAVVRPAEPAATNAPDKVLLNDNFGKLVAVPTNAVPATRSFSSSNLRLPGEHIMKRLPNRETYERAIQRYKFSQGLRLIQNKLRQL